MGRRFGFVAAVALCTALAGPPARGALTGARHFVYRIAWNGLPAGSAMIDVTNQQFSGAAGYVVEATAATNTFVNLFWSFRGVARTALLADGLVPLRFTYDREINRVPESTWLDFDRGAQREWGSHFKGDQRKVAEIDGTEVADPITAVLLAQAAGLEPGGERRYQVFTGEAEYVIVLRGVAEEDISVPAGHFPALKIDPEVWRVKDADAALDQRLRQATVWVSRDPAHAILRIRSEVFIGAVTLDLVQLGTAS